MSDSVKLVPKNVTKHRKLVGKSVTEWPKVVGKSVYLSPDNIEYHVEKKD